MKYYFLSRPRRFGRSLLLDTIGEVFGGDRELFQGLGYTIQIMSSIRSAQAVRKAKVKVETRWDLWYHDLWDHINARSPGACCAARCWTVQNRHVMQN